MRIKRSAALLLILTAITVCSSIAKADSVTFSLGNNPEPNEENVLLNSGAIGASVFGLTNQSQLQVSFTSTSDTLVEPSSGQARIESLDGLLNNITVSIPSGTFQDIIFNPFFGSGNANVNVTTANNQAFNFSYALGNGQNFLTIVAGPATSIFSVTIDATGGFTDLRQVRISGAQANVPEPAAMLLLGSGLVGIAAKLRRRHKRSTFDR